MASNVSVEINLSIRAVYDQMTFSNFQYLVYTNVTNKQSVADSNMTF